MNLEPYIVINLLSMQQGFKVTLVYIVVTNFALWKLAVVIILGVHFQSKKKKQYCYTY